VEHCTNRLNRKHEESSLVHIKRAYKFTAPTPLFQIRLHLHMGQEKKKDRLEWQER